MKKKLLVCFIIIIVIILVPLMYLINTKDKEQKNLSSVNNKKEEADIIELKNQLGITGKTDIYTIAEEYDGRKVLTINPSIQFKVVMAGVLSKSKPELKNIDNMLQNEPKKNGIWISEQSRSKIKEIIENITQCKYTIDEAGYLNQENVEIMNKYDEKLKKILTSDKLYSIDISGKCYILDEVTGEIVEDLFEEMDPYTPYEYFENSNKSIFIITTNSKGKLDYNEVVKEIIENIGV